MLSESNEKRKTTDIRMPDGNIVRIEAHSSLSSTAELAKKYAGEGYGDRYVVFTENQSSSKIIGTKLSENDSEYGVFVSCILRPSLFASQAGFLTPLATVALLTALDEYSAKPLESGWLSGIYCEGKKIGGVCIEGKLDSYKAYEYIIISFAIKLDDTNFPPRMSDIIRRIFEDENISIPFIIAKSILKSFFEIYSELKNPTKHIDIYRKRSALIGQTVKYIENEKRRRCRVLGVDENCSLIVECRDKSVKYISNVKNVIIPKKLKKKKA